MPRVWEPDALDVCFCGGPKRFGECCQPRLPLKEGPRGIRAEIYWAINEGKFDRAEELARAALAQYVIWIKQHTTITMHVAQELHKQLVDIDVLALESHIGLLENSLEANGKGELIVAQLRYLAGIIGVPRLSMRLVALASRWLSKSGRTEEAVLELDALGDVDKIDAAKLDDSLALLTIADVCDISPERKEQMLRRALEVAAGKEEGWLVKFELANHALSIGKREEALTFLDSIVQESRSSVSPGDELGEALLFRWRITKDDGDLQSFKAAAKSDSRATPWRYAGILIDEGLYDEAESFLAGKVGEGDPIAKLLVVDARSRGGKTASARDLFRTIGREQIQLESRYLYAVISAQLALLCEDEEIRQLAVLSIRELPASLPKDTDVQNLFLKVQSENFARSVHLE